MVSSVYLFFFGGFIGTHGPHKGVEYRMNLYNLIFQMVIPFLTQPPHERTLTGRGSRVYPNIGAAGCTITSGQPGAAWLGQEVCSGFALARLGLRPRGSCFALAARCMNSYYLLIAQSLLTESSKISCPESCFFPIHHKFLCNVRTCFVHRGVAIYC